ncbi:uncharacterized protein [Linepithema humile]|uniref:uncharacterized protein isoform X1 n=2 Tax=Linepithema humile TaxID=83485 RepID=UPI00351E9C6D
MKEEMLKLSRETCQDLKEIFDSVCRRFFLAHHTLHNFIQYIYDIWIRALQLYLYCDARTTTFYDALWHKIKQLVPQLEQNIEFIISDYEMATIKSLSNKFPKAKLSGCWFYFNQAVLRKWQKLELSPQTILLMTITLPLLPADMFHEALLIIQAEADLLSREHPNVLQFMSYLRLTWLHMASKISTYGCPIRTNNIVESFHNIATQKLGTRNINIRTFLEKFKNLIADQELDLRRLKNDIQPRRTHTRTNRERNTKNINAQKNLIEKRLPLKQFLLMFNRRNDIFQIEQLASFDALSCDEQVTDRTFFADDFNVSIQTEKINIRRRRSQCRNRIILSNSREKDNNLEANTEKDTESECNDSRVTASTQETISAEQNETLETLSNIIIFENVLSNSQDDESIYEVLDDDYGY